MDDAGIPALVDAIKHHHGLDATWVESVLVRETHEGAVVWDGEVQVFDVKGHPKATRCYAWSYATTGAKRRFVAVLGAPPVDSPRKAVQVEILAVAKRAQN